MYTKITNKVASAYRLLSDNICEFDWGMFISNGQSFTFSRISELSANDLTNSLQQ